MILAMEYHLRKILLMALVLLSGSAAIAGPLGLRVTYPKSNQNIAAVDSTFIFGSVAPGSSLSINGTAVKVHEDGGWLAFLPVTPGAFDFAISAENNGILDTLTVPVKLPELPDYSYDSLYFLPGSFKPAMPLWVRPGEEIELAFTATPYCNAICIIANTNDTIVMKEVAPQNYYWGRNVFQKGTLESSPTPDSLLIRGVYRGRLVVPNIEDDSLQLIYSIFPPSFMQLTWMIKYAAGLQQKPLVIHDLGALPSIKSDTSRVPIKILKPGTPMVSELIDSLTVIRTGPGKGYLCIHQPAGIQAEVAGKEGRWLKLKLSDYQFGWVPDTAVIFKNPGTVPPHSYIRRVQTINNEDKVSVVVSASARHPFRIIENLEEKSITLFIYGADSDTDWIRYDNRDSLIDHIVWFQPEPGIYGLKIYMKQKNIWGYDGYYVGSDLFFDLKKFPRWKKEVSDLRIILDPGHAPDPGAIGPTGLTEKEANLNIVLQLKKDLEREGAEVVLTRASDTLLPLYDRPKIATREKADIFISVHNNALPDGTNPFENNGFSTYYYHPHSAALAHAVQNSMSRRIKLNDFDWYYGNLAVNRPTQYPAILIECAFMMIPEQEALLKTDKFRNKLSQAIIEGIKDFLRGRPLTDWDRQQDASYNR